MLYQYPNIEQFNSTPVERDIAARFTRIVEQSNIIPETSEVRYSIWMVVEHQYFQLREERNYLEACWYCWMLAKALLQVKQTDLYI